MQESDELYRVAYEYTHRVDLSTIHWALHGFDLLMPDCTEMFLESFQPSDRIRCFITFLETAEPEKRRNMELDLFKASVKLNGLEQFTDLLVYGEFKLQDMSTGKGFKPNEGDIIARRLSNIPTALATMFFNTQELVTKLKPRAYDVFRHSRAAHEYQWMLVETNDSIEFEEIPWPTLGIPKTAADLKEEGVKGFFCSVYEEWRESSR